MVSEKKKGNSSDHMQGRDGRRKTKGATHMRDKSTVARLKMYRDSGPKRDKKVGVQERRGGGDARVGKSCGGRLRYEG